MPPDPVLALVSDLFFGSRIAAAARAAGVAVRTVRTLAELERVLGEGAPRLVLVDLEAPGADPLEAIARCRRLASPPRVVAFGPHVQEELLDAARARGADEALPRGALTASLPRLLRGARPGPA